MSTPLLASTTCSILSADPLAKADPVRVSQPCIAWVGEAAQPRLARSPPVSANLLLPIRVESLAKCRPSRTCRKTRTCRPGLAARELAVRLVAGVLMQKRPLEQVLAECPRAREFAALEARDRALARAVAATVLRRQGELEHVLSAFLERPLPPTRAACGRSCSPAPPSSSASTCPRTRSSIWRWRRPGATAARIASPSWSMPCCGASPSAGRELLAAPGSRAPQHPRLAVAALERGLRRRRPRAASPRRACARRPSTSASRRDAPAWAERLGGRLLPTGSIRLARARPHRGPARLRRGRVVGAGRGRSAGDARRRRCRRQHGRGPVRRARRQDRGSGRRRRPSHGRRPVGRRGSTACART